MSGQYLCQTIRPDNKAEFLFNFQEMLEALMAELEQEEADRNRQIDVEDDI